MNIGVIGVEGLVGRTIADNMPARGNQVYGNDIVRTGRMNYSKAIVLKLCQVIFVCVATPVGVGGAADLRGLKQAISELVDKADGMEFETPPLIVIKSTVPPGTTNLLQKTYSDFEFAMVPEFLREASAISDYLCPDRLVFGVNSDEAWIMLCDVYRAWPPMSVRLRVTPTEAELVKHLSNAFLVLKVAFGLEAGQLCDLAGVTNPYDVMHAVGMDSRINGSHLNPVKGRIRRDTPCLAKDLWALMVWARQKGYCPGVLATAEANGVMRT